MLGQKKTGGGGQAEEELTPGVEPGLVLVARSRLHIRLWLNLTHLLVHTRLHMHGVLDVRSGRLLDLLLLLLLLLLLKLLWGTVVVCRWHRSWGGISSVRVCGGGEIGMGQCFGGSDALGRVKLQQAFQQVDCWVLISIQCLGNAR